MKVLEEALLAVDGLGKRFGDRWALRDLSFTLRAGSIVGMVGANGGGKTTTLRLLAGLIRPDAGKGHVLGHDIRDLDTDARRQIGYMSQRLSLYPELTVKENLAFRGALLTHRPTPLINRAVDRYGLDKVLHTRFDRLSGGWARRAQFAAVTLDDPQILLLDEPTAGLDVVTRQLIWGWLGDLASAGHGVVISTHDLSEAERCPYILHYDEGRVTKLMPPADLVAQTGSTDLEDAVARLAMPAV